MAVGTTVVSRCGPRRGIEMRSTATASSFSSTDCLSGGVQKADPKVAAPGLPGVVPRRWVQKNRHYADSVAILVAGWLSGSSGGPP